jgi:hypothetical protein
MRVQLRWAARMSRTPARWIRRRPDDGGDNGCRRCPTSRVRSWLQCGRAMRACDRTLWAGKMWHEGLKALPLLPTAEMVPLAVQGRWWGPATAGARIDRPMCASEDTIDRCAPARKTWSPRPIAGSRTRRHPHVQRAQQARWGGARWCVWAFYVPRAAQGTGLGHGTRPAFSGDGGGGGGGAGGGGGTPHAAHVEVGWGDPRVAPCCGTGRLRAPASQRCGAPSLHPRPFTAGTTGIVVQGAAPASSPPPPPLAPSRPAGPGPSSQWYHAYPGPGEGHEVGPPG